MLGHVITGLAMFVAAVHSLGRSDGVGVVTALVAMAYIIAYASKSNTIYWES